MPRKEPLRHIAIDGCSREPRLLGHGTEVPEDLWEAGTGRRIARGRDHWLVRHGAPSDADRGRGVLSNLLGRTRQISPG
jgi:hypothetical protein